MSTAKSTVISTIKRKLHMDVKDIRVVDDKDPDKPPVIKFEFKEKVDASHFSKIYKATMEGDNFVIFGQDKAAFVFDKLGIITFNSELMYYALKRELYIKTQQKNLIPNCNIKIAEYITPKLIAFYGDYGDYLFGNFFEMPNYYYDGIKYRNTEAAFQAQKLPHVNRGTYSNYTGDEAFQANKILKSTPHLLDEKYRTNNKYNGKWDKDKDDIMKSILREKFKQGPEYANCLLNTNNAYLVEHIVPYPKEDYWGDNFNGTGQKKLGKILMEIRGELGGTGVVSEPPEYNIIVKNRQFSEMGSSIPLPPQGHQVNKEIINLLDNIEIIKKRKDEIDKLIH